MIPALPQPIPPSATRATWSPWLAWVVGVLACWPFLFLRTEFNELFWFGDEWDLLDQIQRTGFAAWAFQAFAENFVPLFKLLWFGLVAAGGGNYGVVIGAMWLTHAATVALLGLLLREGGMRAAPAMLVMAVFGFSSTNIETLGWSVQWSAVLATAFFLVAAWWMLRRVVDHDHGGTWRDRLILGLLCAASALCFSRGVLTGSALAVVALWPATAGWWSRFGPRFTHAAIAFAPGLAVAVLIVLTQAGGNHQELGQEEGQFADMLRYAWWYYGMNPFHRLFEIGSWGWRTTTLLTAAKVLLTLWVLRRAAPREAWVFWLLLIFDVGNAVLLGLGRYHTGLETAHSSRYQYAALICTLPFVAFALQHAADSAARLLPALAPWRTAAFALLIVTATWGTTRHWLREIAWFAHHRGQITRDLLFTDPAPPAEGAVPGIPFMPTDRAKQLIEHYNLR